VEAAGKEMAAIGMEAVTIGMETMAVGMERSTVIIIGEERLSFLVLAPVITIPMTMIIIQMIINAYGYQAITMVMDGCPNIESADIKKWDG